MLAKTGRAHQKPSEARGVRASPAAQPCRGMLSPNMCRKGGGVPGSPGKAGGSDETSRVQGFPPFSPREAALLQGRHYRERTAVFSRQTFTRGKGFPEGRAIQDWQGWVSCTQDGWLSLDLVDVVQLSGGQTSCFHLLEVSALSMMAHRVFHSFRVKELLLRYNFPILHRIIAGGRGLAGMQITVGGGGR